MSGRRVAALLGGIVAATTSARGQEGGFYHWARVSQVEASAVAIDAGTLDGVRRWIRFEVIRRGVPVAVLQVASLGDHAARCELVSRAVSIAVGDSIRFLATGLPATQSALATPLPPKPTITPSARADSSAVVRTPRPDATAAVVRPSPAPSPPVVRAPVSPAPPPAPTVTAPARAAPVSPQASPPPVAQEKAVTQAARASDLGPSPAQGGKPRMARVTFLTTVSVYIDAGKAEGLAEGARVDVLHGGVAVAELKVAFVSTHQSSCQVVSKTATLAVGDSARYEPVTPAADSSATLAVGRPAAPGPGTPGWSRRSGYGRLRGRIGLYYLTVQQQDSFGGRFSQPSGDIRLNGSGLGGSPIGLVVDLRSRRLVQALPGTPTSTIDQTRVYQVLVYWQAPGSPFRFTTGRQYAPGISSVGLIDGAAMEVSQATWDYGGFAGNAPDAINLGFSGDSLTQVGGYVRRHNRTGSVSHWAVTTGASGSYVTRHTNREFFYAQGNYQSRRVSVYVVHEVDYYRPWRRLGTGERAFSFTSTFANLQFQATDALSLTAGVDNRRSVRLYQYVINPAITFDDTFRRGIWAGASARFARHFLIGVDARTNHDSSTGTANTYTLTLGADRISPLGVSLRSRSTRYTTLGRAGWLNSVTLGMEPFGRGSVQLTSGWRAEHDTTSAPTLNVRWISLDTDISLGRSLFAILSAYRERGGLSAHDLFYAGLSYGF